LAIHPNERRFMIHPARVLKASMLAGAVLFWAGCGGPSVGKKKDDFFTSGSREADQRAGQRIAQAEQLAGGAERGAKKAKPAEGVKSDDPKAAQVDTKMPLYDRLGGEKGITALVDDFLPRALQDPRVNWARNGVKSGVFRRKKNAWTATDESITLLKKHMVQFIALATGGPAQYDGKEMKTSHDGMQITNPEFDAVIGDLKATLDKLQVPNKEQKEFLAIIESTRPLIVTER
jgi:hemoglobin